MWDWNDCIIMKQTKMYAVRFLQSHLHVSRPLAEWAMKAVSLTTEKNSNSISTKQLWLSGNTKDTPFFCTVAFSCFVNSNDIKVKITAKDDYKPFEKLGWIAVLAHVLFCLIQSTDAVNCDFWFDSITSMTTLRTKSWGVQAVKTENNLYSHIHL